MLQYLSYLADSLLFGAGYVDHDSDDYYVQVIVDAGAITSHRWNAYPYMHVECSVRNFIIKKIKNFDSIVKNARESSAIYTYYILG